MDGQLGQIVTWKVPAMVTLTALRDALTAANLDEELARDLHPRHIFTRALREMKAGRVICRLQCDDAENRVSFQLTRQDAGITEVVYDREAQVNMDLHTGTITADNPEIEERARLLFEDHTAKRLTGDLTRLVQQVFDRERADLVPLREQGGVYFVPDQHKDLVEQVRTLLHGIHGRLNSFAIRLGCADTAQSVADSLSEHLAGLIEEFRASCAGISPDSRDGAIARREGRIAELRRRLECYRGLLGAYAQSIEAEINKADGELLAKLAAPLALAA